MILDMLYWREPLWLLSFLLPWFIIAITYFYQKKIWLQIADPQLLAWLSTHSNSSHQKIRQILLTIAWLLFSIALAGPRTPQWIPPSLQADDVSIMIIVDFSTSMQAMDGHIKRANMDRISQARKLLEHWLDELNPSLMPARMRMGLSIYAAHSHTLLIPSNDKALLKHYIAQLQQFRPPTLGNNLAAALKNAQQLLKPFKGEQHIILLSDGDLGTKSAKSAQTMMLQIQSDERLNLTIIGLGKDEAVSIPAKSNQTSDLDRKTIISRRHISWLKQLAQQSNGKYYNAESLKSLKLEQILNLPVAQIDPRSNHQILWDEWFYIPLLAGIILTLLALQISAIRLFQLTSIFLLIFLGGCDQNRSQLQLNNNINNALLSGDYAKVLTLIKANESLDNDFIIFSEGVACYRLKDYFCAQRAFSSLAWSASDAALKSKAIFNLANTHYKLGDYEQASILFQEAQQLGISATKTQINQAFADSLAAAVQGRLDDIAKTKQRADWLSAAQKLPEEFNDRIAEGIYLSQKNNTRNVFSNLSFNLSHKEQRQLIELGVKYIKTKSKSRSQSQYSENFWVASTQKKKKKQQTAQLFNQLMGFEIGLHYVPEEPLQVQGQRPW